MIKSISDFPHSLIIAEAKLNIADFDNDIKVLLTDFNKRYTGWKLKENPAGLEVLMAQSNVLTQNIYDYYVDKGDQEVVIDNDDLSRKEVKVIVEDIKEAIKEDKNTPPVPPAPPIDPPAPAPVDPPAPAAPIIDANEPTNKNEKALYNILKQKASGITMSDLRAAGFDTSSWGPLSITGCKVGNHRLYKNFSEHVFKLEKI